jgi:hypothetical protein
MNVGIGNKAAQFLFLGIYQSDFGTVCVTLCIVNAAVNLRVNKHNTRTGKHSTTC